MKAELKDNIASCVVKGIRFPGAAGATYTIQDFFDGILTLNTIRAIGSKLEKQLEGKTTSRFSKATRSEADTILELQIDTLVGVLEYKEAKAEAAKKAAETRAANAEKAATIRKLIAEKQLDALGKQDVKDLEKMLEDLEG